MTTSRSTRLRTNEARSLAVALFDLAWLLPRTIGSESTQADPLPRSELEVMRLLARRPGLSVNAVAVELGLQPSNVSAAIRSLVQRGLLERRSGGTDRRVAQLHPTAKALGVRERREEEWGILMTAAVSGLAADHRAALKAALPALAALGAQLSEHTQDRIRA